MIYEPGLIICHHLALSPTLSMGIKNSKAAPLSVRCRGLGAGTGIALAFVLVADIFLPTERVKWQSLFGVVYGSIPQELVGCT